MRLKTGDTKDAGGEAMLEARQVPASSSHSSASMAEPPSSTHGLLTRGLRMLLAQDLSTFLFTSCLFPG